MKIDVFGYSGYVRRAALLFGLIPFLAACGGGEGCPSVFRYVPNARYVGSYIASYTPVSLTVVTRTYAFKVSATGEVTGTVLPSGGTTSSDLEGNGADIVNGCSRDRAGIVLDYAFDADTAEVLAVDKRRNGSLLGSYSAEIRTESNVLASRGTLVVAPATDL